MNTLSDIEQKTLDFLRTVVEYRIRDLPDKRMVGAIATLRDKGYVEFHKRYTSIYRRKKKKFVRVKT